MKKIFVWLFKEILWPLLREVLVDVFKQLIKEVFSQILLLLAKWQARDVESAETEADKESVRKKYAQRRDELAAMSERLLESVDVVVSKALAKAEADRDALLAGEPAKHPEIEGAPNRDA